MQALINLSIAFCAVYSAFVLLVYFGQSRLVYFPEKQLNNTPGVIGLAYTTVSIPVSDGETLHGWWMSVPDAKGAVPFFHHRLS